MPVRNVLPHTPQVVHLDDPIEKLMLPRHVEYHCHRLHWATVRDVMEALVASTRVVNQAGQRVAEADLSLHGIPPEYSDILEARLGQEDVQKTRQVCAILGDAWSTGNPLIRFGPEEEEEPIPLRVEVQTETRPSRLREMLAGAATVIGLR